MPSSCLPRHQALVMHIYTCRQKHSYTCYKMNTSFQGMCCEVSYILKCSKQPLGQTESVKAGYFLKTIVVRLRTEHTVLHRLLYSSYLRHSPYTSLHTQASSFQGLKIKCLISFLITYTKIKIKAKFDDRILLYEDDTFFIQKKKKSLPKAQLKSFEECCLTCLRALFRKFFLSLTK